MEFINITDLRNVGWEDSHPTLFLFLSACSALPCLACLAKSAVFQTAPCILCHPAWRVTCPAQNNFLVLKSYSPNSLLLILRCVVHAFLLQMPQLDCKVLVEERLHHGSSYLCRSCHASVSLLTLKCFQLQLKVNSRSLKFSTIQLSPCTPQA